MRKVVVLFALVFVWGCQERVVSPSGPSTDQSVPYGTTAVTLPGMKMLAKMAPGTVCKFSLVISGDGMQPMSLMFPLGSNDTTVVIDKIPAGSMRLFTGTLYAPNGVSYGGMTYANVEAGKIAYVKLLLRKTGSAQIDVIIEGVNDDTVTAGCYRILGMINQDTLDGLTLQVEMRTESYLHASIRSGTEMVGKFYGPINNDHLIGMVSLPGLTEDVRFDGYFSTDGSYFKGVVYSMADTTVSIGIMHGPGISCEDVPPPPVPEYGCFKLEGTIYSISLDGYHLQTIEQNDTTFFAYFFHDTDMVGKLYGKLDGGTLTGEMVIPGVIEQVGIEGGVSISVGVVTYIKVMVFSLDEAHTMVGNMYGSPIDCEVITIPEPLSCTVDTSGSSSSCKEVDTWIKYATDECRASGGTLGKYTFMEPCGNGKDTTFRYICYECCRKQ